MVPFAILSLVAQERTITGTVMDGEFKGEPLIGANIAVGEGTVTKGTVTDMVLRSMQSRTTLLGFESQVCHLTAV